MTNEQLDIVLFHMASNSADIPRRAPDIVEKAGLDLQKENASLLLNKLKIDGYVDLVTERGYCINGNGVHFINSGGYLALERLKKRNTKAPIKMFLDIVIALVVGLAIVYLGYKFGWN